MDDIMAVRPGHKLLDVIGGRAKLVFPTPQAYSQKNIEPASSPATYRLPPGDTAMVDLAHFPRRISTG